VTRLLELAQNNRKEGTRFVKFLIVGAIGFVVDSGVFSLLGVVLNWPVMLAQTLSFIAAVISNFIWNRYWTYPDSRSKPLGQQLGQFFVVNTAGFAIRSVVFTIALPLYQRLAEAQRLIATTPETLAKYATLATAVTTVLLWNFVINRYWTYNDVK